MLFSESRKKIEETEKATRTLMQEEYRESQELSVAKISRLSQVAAANEKLIKELESKLEIAENDRSAAKSLFQKVAAAFVEIAAIYKTADGG